MRRNLWDLSWPMMFSTLLFALPSLLDGVWLGKLSFNALAAAGIAMSLRIAMISPLMALSMAGGAVVARYVGARDQENADKATFHVVVLMVASSGTIGVVGLLFSERLLYLVGARGEVLPLAVQYVRIIFIGLISMEMVPSLGGVFNAAGNPKVPLRVNLIVASTILLSEPFLVLGVVWFPRLGIAEIFPGLGIVGASLALVMANTLGTLYAFYVLIRGRSAARINIHRLSLDRLMFWRIIRIALPALIHRGTPNFATIVLIRFISAYGAVSLAAYNVFRRVINLAMIPCTALARAAGTMVGQNLGAGKPQRSERAAYIITGTSVTIASFLVLFLALFARSIVGLFSEDPEMIGIGATIIRIMGIGQIFFMANMAMEMGLAGAADTVSPMVINIIALWLIQLPLVYLLSRVVGLGANGIWTALVISLVIQCVATTARFRQGRWKFRRI
ncbi:MATE family efflux transporter [Candidatus Poribacteria bacterium]